MSYQRFFGRSGCSDASHGVLAFRVDPKGSSSNDGNLRYLVDYAMNTPATSDQSLERRIRQLLLLQETAKKVNSILDLEQLLDEIVGGVAEAFGCSRTGVLLKDETTNELEIVALRGFTNVHLKGYRFKIGGEGIIGHVSATGKDALRARHSQRPLLRGE